MALYERPLRPDELMHFGILGMKWGVRRYQNKDGSLTELGKKRLGYSDYSDTHKDDVELKKGTKVTRVVGGVETNAYHDDEPDIYKKELQKFKDKEKNLNTKYVSVDNVRNSGRDNGKDYYTAWFSDSGWNPYDMYVDTYSLKKNVKVASGKQVLDEVLKQVGSKRVADLVKNKDTIKKLTMEYTQNKDLFNNVNQVLVKRGYEAIEDINDQDTDMPVIFLNAKDALQLRSTQTGKDAVDELTRKINKK